MLGWGFPASARQFHIQNWHMEDGLPDGHITALAQTQDGYLWVGTPRGLARFDGIRFKVFKSEDTPALADSRITALLAGTHGGLWIGTADGGVAQIDPSGRFRSLPRPVLPGGSPTLAGSLAGDFPAQWLWSLYSNLAEDKEGTLWWCAAGRGVYRWQNAQWHDMSPFLTNGPGDPRLVCDFQGHPFVLKDGRLNSFQDGRWGEAESAGRIVGEFPVVSPARDGGIWVGSPEISWAQGGGRVRRFADHSWRQEVQPTPWTANSLRSQVTCLLNDREGHLWIGTMWGGVYHTDAGGSWQRLATEGSFSQGLITCLMEDRLRNIWVGTVGDGLYRVTKRPVTMVTLPAPAQENLVQTTCMTKDGSVWLGTDGAGAFRLRNGIWTDYAAAQGLTNQHVCSIFEDHAANLWVGTWGGLFRFENNHFTLVAGPPELRAIVLALFEDRAGGLWIGTRRGLICRRGGQYQPVILKPDRASIDIRAMAEDRSGNLWVGTVGDGLFCIRAGKVVAFSDSEKYPAADALALHCDADGVLWIGSLGAGLFRYLDGKFTAYTSADGLPSDSFNSLMSDDAGNLWASSENGVFGMDRKVIQRYVRGKNPPLLCRRLSLADGLANRACSGSGQPVAGRSMDGRLWFPNMRGVAVFDPSTVAIQRNEPHVVLESVFSDGQELPLAFSEGSDLSVPSSSWRFEFNYTVPDLSAPEHLCFRYKLESYDRDWVEAGSAYDSKLPPGRYQFRVRAGGSDGNWHESARALSLRIVPRIWEVRWMQWVGAISLAGLLIAYVSILSRHRFKRRLELLQLQNAVERERTRIARDIHDHLGASLTQIALMSELPPGRAPDQRQVASQLTRISSKARAVMQTLNEIVWAVNPLNDNLPKLLDYICSMSEELCESAGLRCWQEVPTSLPPTPLNVDFRHNLVLAIREALNNSIKHANASEIWIRAFVKKDHLLVEVQDDGRGFDVNQRRAQGNGLNNLRARLDQIGGRAELASQPGHGTKVTFRASFTQN
jgi:ligand-binding sensor domain-containing protein/signal transduction histidine kinase